MSSTFVEEMSDLSVVAFLQNNTNKKIEQSTMLPILKTHMESKKNEIPVISPNPFCNAIEIKNAKGFSKIAIYNNLGKVIKIIDNTENRIHIPSAHLKSGVYIIYFLRNNGTYESHRVVKY